MMYKILHSKDDIDRLCQEKEAEDSPELRITYIATIQEPEEYTKRAKKDWSLQPVTAISVEIN